MYFVCVKSANTSDWTIKCFGNWKSSDFWSSEWIEGNSWSTKTKRRMFASSWSSFANFVVQPKCVRASNTFSSFSLRSFSIGSVDKKQSTDASPVYYWVCGNWFISYADCGDSRFLFFRRSCAGFASRCIFVESKHRTLDSFERSALEWDIHGYRGP